MISVIIPIKNGILTLDRCLLSLREQTVKDLEIIVLDSMSIDGSREIALKYGAKIIDIPNGTFNHGLTRNIGVSYSSGDFLYFTVQDAWLSENDMLQKMVCHFEDQNVKAVVGHQAVPWGHPDKNPAYWFKRYSEPEIERRYFPKSPVFNDLPDQMKFQMSTWDNVNAMYRKTALTEVAFRNTNYSEDWLWANDALTRGMLLLRDPDLVVYHYHHMTLKYVYETSFIVYYNFLFFFNHKQKILWSPLNFLKASYTIIKRREINFFKKIYWIFHTATSNLGFFISSTHFNILGKKKLKNHFLKLSKQLPQGRQNS